MSLCEAAALDNPAFVCCPEPPPSDCSDEAWAFSPIVTNPKYYGCCTQDLTTTIWCGNSGTTFSSLACTDICGYTGVYMYCVSAPTVGDSCANAFEATTFPTTWNANWSDYGNSFTPSDYSCGSGGNDAWATVVVPASATVQVQETTTGGVNLRRVSGCSATTCITYDDTAPETLTLSNPGLSAQTFYVVISYLSGTTFTLSFTLL